MVDPVKLNPCGHSLGKESAIMTVNATNKCPHPDCGATISDFTKDLDKANEITKYNKAQQ